MLGAAYLVLVLASCQRSSDEEQLLQAVDAMEVAIEAGETGDLMPEATGALHVSAPSSE